MQYSHHLNKFMHQIFEQFKSQYFAAQNDSIHIGKTLQIRCCEFGNNALSLIVLQGAQI